MTSSSGTSSASSLIHNSGSEGNLQAVMDQRKRKRMVSNRESARRSRMRKQKQLDDLMSQVTELKNEKQQIISRITITTQQYLNVESDNSILRAQVSELTKRLESLNEIVNNSFGGGGDYYGSSGLNEAGDCFMMNPLNMGYLNHPIMASADMFLC